MDVILLERIEKLGQMGDVVKVKPGFARNFLLPKRKALRASKSNLELFESQRKQLEADNLERRQEAEKVGEKLNGLTVSVIRSAGDTGQLYGSVSARDITEAVAAAGFTITRGQVDMDRPVKALGLHEFRIRLHPEVAVTITVNVARSPEEAEIQAKLGRAVINGEELEAADERPEEGAAPTPEELNVFDTESVAVSPADAEDAKGS